MSTNLTPGQPAGNFIHRAARNGRYVLAVMASMVVCGPVPAATVNVTATGTFSAYSDPGGQLPFAEPAPGTVFTLTFQYDDQATDLVSEDQALAVYLNAAHSGRLSFGSELFVASGNSSIFVFDDLLNPDSLKYGDTWQNWQRISSTVTTEHSFGLSLLTASDTTPVTPLTSDALVLPFGPAGWDTVAAIRYRVVETPAVGDPIVTAYAEASLTSISASTVPVPPSVWLFATAMAFATRYRRKKK